MRQLRVLLGFAVVAMAFEVPAQAGAQESTGPAPRRLELTDDRVGVAFSLVRSLGSLDGKHDAFGNIWDVELDSRGNLYIADVGQAHVTVFDGDGQFVRTIGRRGSGPGEFQQPMQLGVGPGDTLLVYDVGLKRLTQFTPDGRLLRQRDLGRIPTANDLEFLRTGEIVLTGFTALGETIIHILDRELNVIRSFGDPASLDVQYFSESLLGGYVDITPSGLIVYSQKSPFELRVYRPDGQLVSRCVGLEGETTPPQDVVRVTGDRRQLQWNRFIHTAAVFALSDELFLNMITDPTRDRRRLDVIDRDCRLRATSVMEAPFLFTSSRQVGSQRLFSGVRTVGNIPEAVVYRFSLRK